MKIIALTFLGLALAVAGGVAGYYIKSHERKNVVDDFIVNTCVPRGGVKRWPQPELSKSGGATVLRYVGTCDDGRVFELVLPVDES